MTKLSDYWDRLKRHDWYYAFSDDGRVYRAGAAESDAIRTIAKESPEHQALYDGFQAAYSTDLNNRPPVPPCPRDWVEDSSHENGNYQNKCMECEHSFVGHKRRVVCKECAS